MSKFVDVELRVDATVEIPDYVQGKEAIEEFVENLDINLDASADNIIVNFVDVDDVDYGDALKEE